MALIVLHNAVVRWRGENHAAREKATEGKEGIIVNNYKEAGKKCARFLRKRGDSTKFL